MPVDGSRKGCTACDGCTVEKAAGQILAPIRAKIALGYRIRMKVKSSRFVG